jgi:hypothetical protein
MPDIQDVKATADKVNFTWTATPYATRYDVVRGQVASLPVGPGGADEVCLNDLSLGPGFGETAIPPAGTGYWYVVRPETAYGNGTFGNQHDGSPRTTTSCP